jgi:hypothetical protein
MVRAFSTFGREERRTQVFGGKPDGKSPLGKLRRRREDIKIDLQEMGCRDMDWIQPAQDRDRR